MLRKRTGFTLIELLIAAAIIGVLAMFATQAFRASASDVRISDAKARALLLVNAAERYYAEYPGAASFSNGNNEESPIPFLIAPDASNRTDLDKACDISSPSVQDLVDCGFLEYRQLAYENKSSQGQVSGSVEMWFEVAGPAKVCVCLKGKGRVTDTNTYCTSGGNFSENCN